MSDKRNTVDERRDLFDIRTPKELLIALLIGGGLVTILGTAPWLLAGAFPAVAILKDSRKNRQRVSYALWYAKKRNYISQTKDGNKTNFALTEKGARLARKNLIKVMARHASARRTWDKKWRLILFDVPMEDHMKRNAFRQLIKRLGATKLQQSVWLYPHDCSEELALLQDFFGFNEEQIRMIVTGSIGEDRAYRKIFNI